MVSVIDEPIKRTYCPRCGFAFNTSDPRVLALPHSTQHFWMRDELERFRQGREMRLTEIASLVFMTHPAVFYHLRRLCAAGLVETHLKRAGGVYNLYRGVISKS